MFTFFFFFFSEFSKKELFSRMSFRYSRYYMPTYSHFFSLYLYRGLQSIVLGIINFGTKLLIPKDVACELSIFNSCIETC